MNALCTRMAAARIDTTSSNCSRLRYTPSVRGQPKNSPDVFHTSGPRLYIVLDDSDTWQSLVDSAVAMLSQSCMVYTVPPNGTAHHYARAIDFVFFVSPEIFLAKIESLRMELRLRPRQLRLLFNGEWLDVDQFVALLNGASQTRQR
jgi:hypothetical protein